MQVYETQIDLTEAREELELMRLKLEVAQQEAQQAKRQAAEAAAATAAFMEAQGSPGFLSPVARRSLSKEVPRTPFASVTLHVQLFFLAQSQAVFSWLLHTLVAAACSHAAALFKCSAEQHVVCQEGSSIFARLDLSCI